VQGGPEYQEAAYIFQELIDKFGPSVTLLNGQSQASMRHAVLSSS
jgi:hypothetical protein